MTLIAELDAEQFERVRSGEATTLAVPLTAVEVRQADGLLTHKCRPVAVQMLGTTVAMQLGVAEGGPPIRVYLARQEEQDG